MSNPVLHLINGVFFQAPADIAVDFPPNHPAMRSPGTMFPWMYSGFIGRDETCVLDTQSGAMLDDFGASTLHEVVLGDRELAFTKQYVDGRPPIFYRFTRGPSPGRLWVGSYSGEGVVSGYTHCVVSLAPAGFFNPP